MSIQRYNPILGGDGYCDECYAKMEEEEDGTYVQYADAVGLEEEIARLEAEVKRLKAEIAHIYKGLH